MPCIIVIIILSRTECPVTPSFATFRGGGGGGVDGGRGSTDNVICNDIVLFTKYQ